MIVLCIIDSRFYCDQLCFMHFLNNPYSIFKGFSPIVFNKKSPGKYEPLRIV